MPRTPLARAQFAAALLLLAGFGVLGLLLAHAPKRMVRVRAVESNRSTLTDGRESKNRSTEPKPAGGTVSPEPLEPGFSSPTAAPRRQPIESIDGPEVVPGLTPVLLLQNTRRVISNYCARFGGNPVGNNREITAQLNGGNQKQVVFLKPEDGMRMNDRGELIDNWGTPFFFHQISGTEMEIHSAGSDRKMWTADDLVIK